MSIIKTNNKGLLIVVSGPSGAGKGTINGELLKRNKNIWMSTSMTTREPRGTEENGKEYFFVSKEEFEERIKNDQFLEYAIVHSGKYYGTPKDKIYDIDKTSNLFHMLERIQDEVHNFTIRYHRDIRSKGALSSILDDIPGIGNKRKKELLKKYTNINKMKEASIEELSNILPKDVAYNLYEFLKKE